MVPESSMQKCCSQLGSSTLTINGTFGCPYNSVFRNENTTSDNFAQCCRGNTECIDTHCISSFFDTPFPGDASPSATSTSTATPTATLTESPQTNQAFQRQHRSILFAIMLLSLILVN
jgi:hypothetical protein